MMRSTLSTCMLLATSILLSACSDSKEKPEVVAGADGPTDQTPIVPAGSEPIGDLSANQAYQSAAQSVSDSSQPVEVRGSAKNIILFVGDGMGVSTITAARILDGQIQGKPGEEHLLSWEAMPFVGLSKTYNINAQTADSAGTMSAIMTGVKTNAGVMGVDEDVKRGDCASQAGNELVTALELAEIAGMSTGIVSTARITHATPAATFAKSVERGWENNAAMPAEAISQGCEDIAAQLVSFENRLEAQYPGLEVDGMELAMGGGRRHFLPNDPAANSSDTANAVEGARTDGINLTEQWMSRYPQGAYITDQAGFDNLNVEATSQVLGLFNESHMEYAANRVNDLAGEPSLAQMTSKAIDLLDNNERGYFLSVEAGRIDHAHHAGSAYGALTDTIELSKAVQAAMDMSDPADTLIIVTADHSHVFSMGVLPSEVIRF